LFIILWEISKFLDQILKELLTEYVTEKMIPCCYWLVNLITSTTS